MLILEVNFFEGISASKILLPNKREIYMDSLNDTKQLVVRPKHITQVTGLSATTVWRLERDGKFPQRRKIGPGCVGWIYSEIEAWMNDCERVA